MQHELARGFELGRHVGKAKCNGLMFDDGFAEAFTLLRVGERNLVGGAGHAHGLRRDADATAFQIGQRDTVALAFGAEPVLLRNAELLETNFAGVGRLLAHLALDPADAIAGLLGIDDEAADALLALPEIGRGKDQRHVGVLARGDELLVAVKNIASVADARRECGSRRHPSRSAVRSGRRRSTSRRAPLAANTSLSAPACRIRRAACSRPSYGRSRSSRPLRRRRLFPPAPAHRRRSRCRRRPIPSEPSCP